jgi:hypothetical protein
LFEGLDEHKALGQNEEYKKSFGEHDVAVNDERRITGSYDGAQYCGLFVEYIRADHEQEKYRDSAQHALKKFDVRVVCSKIFIKRSDEDNVNRRPLIRRKSVTGYKPLSVYQVCRYLFIVHRIDLFGFVRVMVSEQEAQPESESDAKDDDIESQKRHIL